MKGGIKLWRYAALARMWSWCLIGSALALIPFSVLLQSGASEGVDGVYLGSLLGVSGATGLVLYPLFRRWFGDSALPSSRLPRARAASGPRRLPAGRADWRRWGAVIAAVLLVGGVAMLIFLVAVLGRGGIAEGVVVGMMAAWGAATLVDARAIGATEADEGREYYAACRRPMAVADDLVYVDRAARRPPPPDPAGRQRPRDSGKRRSGRSA